jgi:clan AA aspartic protease
MTGTVDDSGRALVRIRLRHPTTAVEITMEGWVDTGFTGDLVLPQTQILELGLQSGLAVGAVLADGSQIVLDTYPCHLEWFGEWKEIEIISNTGQYPLIGVGLLRDHELHVDYRTKKITID